MECSQEWHFLEKLKTVGWIDRLDYQRVQQNGQVRQQLKNKVLQWP